MKNSYEICSRCIMDISDSKIKFDPNGLCEYCINFDKIIKPNWKNSLKNKEILNQLSDSIRNEGVNKDFDSLASLLY